MSKDIFYDKDIREPLFDFLEDSFGKVRILEEKRTGSARADVVMITSDFLYGIEIKSDADTYARLEKQVKNYNWYYDRNIMMYQRENSFRHSRWGMNRWPSAFCFAVSSCSFIFSFVVIRALAFYIFFHCFK